MIRKNFFLIFILQVISFGFCYAFSDIPDTNESYIINRLKSIPEIVEIKKLTTDSLYKESYEILIRQPVNHQNLSDGEFIQHVFLSHIDTSKPMLIETEGYAAYSGNRTREISSILKSNQIVVEHRYFGNSKPDPIEWKYLTLKQSADDLHHITTIFKTIYKHKWISSGISKGGQTTLIYRYFYPNDVDISVPYVAPIPLSQEDPRTLTFLRTVGTEECRQKIMQFQKDLLKREDEILPLLKEYGEKNQKTFSIGIGTAFEFIVLEYSFSFWQWGKFICDSIPSPGMKKEEIFRHLQSVVSLNDYTDQGMELYKPSMYQNYTEIGYYCFDISDFKNDLKAVTGYTSNRILAPKDVPLIYNGEVMEKIHEWLQREANNIIFIYGENDTWSACAIQLIGATNSIKVVKKDGFHGTRIKNLADEQKDLIYSSLEKWLDLKIDRH